MQDAEQKGIRHMLCVGIDLDSYSAMYDLVSPYQNISVSVGVHPNVTADKPASIDDLLNLAVDDKVIAIGETGLDFFHDTCDFAGQKQRFQNHIHVAKTLNKPLIIHTRDAGHQSLDILKQEKADQVGGIIHCFTEDWSYAEKALDLNFYISFSGIVTFKNAVAIQEVARKVPEDRFLIETDSPFLAPAPYRGKPNYPTYVSYVAEFLAKLRGQEIEQIANLSSRNFYQLFRNSKLDG